MHIFFFKKMYSHRTILNLEEFLKDQQDRRNIITKKAIKYSLCDNCFIEIFGHGGTNAYMNHSFGMRGTIHI